MACFHSNPHGCIKLVPHLNVLVSLFFRVIFFNNHELGDINEGQLVI